MNTLLQVLCLWIVTFGFTAAHTQYSSIKGVDTSKPGIMNDVGLRGIATTAPAPTYPATSLAREVTGVAVAAILLDRNGHLQSLNVLQAADDAIGKSVHDALLRWTFRPLGVPMKGKLFFYFMIKKGSGSVASPAEMNPAISHDQNPATKHGDDAVNEIKEAQLELMDRTRKPSILDIRDRPAYQKRHRDGAVNIPLDEVWPRASIELPLSVSIVVDCYPEQPQSLCRMAARILSYSGFDKVSVLAR
jgi:rhodanese-related sulfurtransferase